MKYEDLSRMYWDINRLWNDLCNDSDVEYLTNEQCFNIEWILATLHEEMRECETSDIPY